MEAEQRKHSKYSHLEATHCYIPVTIETLRAKGHEARSLFKEIARHIKNMYLHEERAQEHLLQWVAVGILLLSGIKACLDFSELRAHTRVRST